ncbi:MAG: hypothetical protein QM526_01060 [Alphaproteobacteria bacterium]|nr:hypothetical protein [Alphaproteobacteria bacterium]
MKRLYIPTGHEGSKEAIVRKGLTILSISVVLYYTKVIDITPITISGVWAYLGWMLFIFFIIDIPLDFIVKKFIKDSSALLLSGITILVYGLGIYLYALWSTSFFLTVHSAWALGVGVLFTLVRILI